MLAGATVKAVQPSGVRGTTKAQENPSASPPSTKATSEELAAINRLCDGLHRIKSNLQQIKGPLSEIRKMNSELKQVSMKIKQESLTPHSEKRVVEKKPSGGGSEKSSGLTPAEKTKGQIGATQQMQKINGNARRIKGSLVLIKNNIEQEWKGMEGDLRKVSGSSRISSQDRKCISKEVKELENETASLQSQANNLKSQTDDLRSQFEQQYGQGSCNDRVGQDCNPSQCEDCCRWQFKITQDEVSRLRSDQEWLRNNCINQCLLAAFDCNAKFLFGLIADTQKDIQERKLGNVRTMTGI
jgi:chaperonin cofactor prefoldin